MKRRTLSILLATMLCLLVSCVTAMAAETVDSGTCGDNLTWVLDDEGTLTISGTGEMENYDDYYTSSPWYNNEDIIAVVIENGVTSIGDYAFYSCNSLTSIEIPDSVTSIGDCAFYSCNSLTSIEIPDSVKSIGAMAFGTASGGQMNITNIELNEGLESIGYGAFAGCTNLAEIIIPYSVTSIGAYAFGYSLGTNWSDGGIESMHSAVGVVASPVTVYGYEGTAAEKYVEEYGVWESPWDDSVKQAATFVSLGVYDAINDASNDTTDDSVNNDASDTTNVSADDNVNDASTPTSDNNASNTGSNSVTNVLWLLICLFASGFAVMAYTQKRRSTAY